MNDSRFNVLFVDDEQRVLRSLKSVFRHDYNVFTATCGEDALALMAEQSIDVLVSDQRMQGMLGHELLAQAYQRYPQTMRLLLTGYMDREAIVQTINEGEVYRFINKPWSVDDIKRCVAEAAQASKIEAAAYEKSDASALCAGAFEPQVADASESVAQPVVSVKQPVSLLLMEPDARIRHQVRHLSHEHGIQVYGGLQYYEDAVKTLILRPNVGVVIMGMSVCAEETIEAINLFKRHRPDVVVIALAQATDAQVAVELINRGQVFRYLAKPLDQGVLKEVIGLAMQRHRVLKHHQAAQARYQVETNGLSLRMQLRRLIALFRPGDTVVQVSH